MLKILIISPHDFPVPAVKGGAVQILVQYLVDENIENQRIDLTVCSLFDKEVTAYEEKYKSAKFLYIKKSRWEKFREKRVIQRLNNFYFKIFKRLLFESPYIKKIYKKIRNENFDYVICESGEDESFGYLSGKLGRQHMIYRAHVEKHGNFLLKNWFSKYLCVSNYVARVLTSNGRVRFEDAYVLNNCVNLELFAQQLTDNQRAELLAKYGLSETDFIISYTGRLIPEKGVRELLLAFKEVCKTADCKLLIIGNANNGYEIKTEYQAELESLTQELRDKVIFTGHLHHSKMQKVMKLSSLSVLPSVCNEAALMTTIESMAASVPVITLDAGGITEYAHTEVCTVLKWSKNIVHDLADSILKLIENEERRSSIKIRAYNHVQKFSLSSYYNHFCDIIEDIHQKRQ